MERKAGRPKVNSQAQTELDKAQEQFDAFENQIKDLTFDRMNEAPKKELEPQTKLSQRQIDNSKEIYLKPERTISSKEKFNEDYRDDYNFAKEFVRFIAEHKELIGETIELWTKSFAGVPAEFWRVPTNKPVWGPRYLAEQINRKSYRRLKMDQSTVTGSDSMGQYFGSIVVDTAIPRLEARPVTDKKSIFMGASSF